MRRVGVLPGPSRGQQLCQGSEGRLRCPRWLFGPGSA